MESFAKPGRKRLFDRAGGKLVEIITYFLSERFTTHPRPCHSDNSKLFWQKVMPFQIIQRRNKLPFGQVTGCAEDDHYTWISSLSLHVTHTFLFSCAFHSSISRYRILVDSSTISINVRMEFVPNTSSPSFARPLIRPDLQSALRLLGSLTRSPLCYTHHTPLTLQVFY